MKARTAAQVRDELHALRQTANRYQGVLNEGGDGFNPHSERLRALEAEYDARLEAEVTAAYQARLAAEDAEWTREVTIARRAAWNAWVRAQGRTIHPAQMAAHCQELGYDALLLKRQIVRHGL
jgi:hypothetical protein